MKDYSQNGEQRYILEYFGDFKGTFLDIGANDGITLSNTYALKLNGWNAYLVEPSLAAYSKLADNFSAFSPFGIGSETTRLQVVHPEGSVMPGYCALVQAAVTTQDGPIDLYDSGTHLKKGDVALLSTTVPKEMDRWKKSGEVFTKTTVRGITFETLMRETGQTKFDFISIDAEGMDFEILRQIDLRAVGCRMLCIEFNQSAVAESLMRAYCAAHGLHLHYRNFENLIFVV